MRQARCSAVVGEVKAACLTSIIVLEECDEVIFGSSNIGHFLRPFVHIFGCHDHRDHTRMTARQPRKNRMKEEWIWYRSSSSIFRNQCIRKAVTQQIIEFSFKKVLNIVFPSPHKTDLVGRRTPLWSISHQRLHFHHTTI